MSTCHRQKKAMRAKVVRTRFSDAQPAMPTPASPRKDPSRINHSHGNALRAPLVAGDPWWVIEITEYPHTPG